MRRIDRREGPQERTLVERSHNELDEVHLHARLACVPAIHQWCDGQAQFSLLVALLEELLNNSYRPLPSNRERLGGVGDVCRVQEDVQHHLSVLTNAQAARH